MLVVQPYLNFNGRCEEAIEFYRKALGAEVTMLMRYKDSPDPHEHTMVSPGAENKLGAARRQRPRVFGLLTLLETDQGH